MYGGIDQLVDTYKGNPQPLAQKMQKAQQGQPPGKVPPDLEEAIALQKIAELRNSAQGQQAMQAGGAQPSIVDKLKQMIGQNQMQAQMQGQPVMAASGGSIDQLMSNLGQYYAGGGIVAFDGTAGSRVKDPDEEDKKAKQREADRRALLEPLTALGDIAQLPIAAGYNLVADTGSGLERFLNRIGSALTGKEVNTQSDNQVGNKFRFSPTPFTDMLRKPTEKEAAVQQAQAAAQTPNAASIRSQLNAADAARFAEKPAPKPPALPRPPAANVNAPAAPAAPAKPALDPNSLRALSEKMIREEMGLSPDTERDKAVDWARRTMGLDALLGAKEGRVKEYEQAMAEAKANRTPEWIKALQAAGGAPVRGGVGMLLGQMGAAATKTREAYAEEDLAYKKELNRLRDIITDAQISGNKELAKEGMAAYREVDNRRKAALTSATSLLNTDATTETSRQNAKDAAAARAQSAAAQLEEKRLRRQQQQQQFLAGEERKWQDTLNRNPDYKKLVDQRSMQERLLYMSTDPKVQEKAQAAVDALNERIAKMLPTTMGGMAGAGNLPPGAKFLGFEPSKK